jgi:hypothetical protein
MCFGVPVHVSVHPRSSKLGTLLAFSCPFVGLTYQGKKDFVVFRFTLEYSSLRDFHRPLGNNIYMIIIIIILLLLVYLIFI